MVSAVFASDLSVSLWASQFSFTLLVVWDLLDEMLMRGVVLRSLVQCCAALWTVVYCCVVL